MAIAKGMNCMVRHIYKEGNQVADLMVYHGLSLTSIFCWQEALAFIVDTFVKNKLSWSNFRMS